MNTFATIKPITRYKKVAYYSVCINGCENSLFEEFMNYHTTHNKAKLNHVLDWIKLIGDKYGAQTDFFRSEAETADASALPPKGKSRPPHYTEYGKAAANNLRLYCLKANPHVVFLFNGNIKTTHYPQDCPNVKEHFKLANLLTKAIDNAFINKDLVWIEDFTAIDCEEDFKLEY